MSTGFRLLSSFFIAFLVTYCCQAAALDSNFLSDFAQKNFIFQLLGYLLAGFLTSLTPCVYPLIPITLSIVGIKNSSSLLQSFLLAATYVFGMVVLYCSLGMSFAWLGIVFGSLFTQSWFLISLAIFFSVISLSLLGVFNLVLPQKFLQQLSRIFGKGYRAAFLMGVAAGFIATPCTGPVLAGILALLANKQNILQASIYMLCYSLGLGFPFLILGTFSSLLSKIPKGGSWMLLIKDLLGAWLLAIGFHFAALAFAFKLSNSLEWTWWQIACAGILGFISLQQSYQRTTKMISFFLKIIGISLLSSALYCGIVLAFFAQEQTVNSQQNWIILKANGSDNKLHELLKKARNAKKPVFIDFYADWCVACKQLEKEVLSQREFENVFKNMQLIRIDTTTSNRDLERIQKEFSVLGLPTIILISPDGHQEKLTGYVNIPQLREKLRKIMR